MHFFTLLAIVAFGYCVYDFVTFFGALKNQQATIVIDSGSYYLLIMSIFFLFSFVSIFGKKAWAAKLVKNIVVVMIVWFIGALSLGYLTPVYLQSKLEASGYTKMESKKDSSRLYIGESLVYQKSGNIN